MALQKLINARANNSDTPLALFNSYGAWTDSRIVDDYFNYATFVISRYDQYVPIWYTFNEPQYATGNTNTIPPATPKETIPPITASPADCPLESHAVTTPSSHTPRSQNGTTKYSKVKAGSALRTPETTSKPTTPPQQPILTPWLATRVRSRLVRRLLARWRLFPNVKDTLGSMLPTFTQAEKDMIKGSCDFYAIDGYTGFTA